MPEITIVQECQSWCLCLSTGCSKPFVYSESESPTKQVFGEGGGGLLRSEEPLQGSKGRETARN